MLPDGILKSTLFGGFEKTSAEAYLRQMLLNLNQLEVQNGQPQTVFDTSALKKNAFGSGYSKESVLAYIDSILQKSEALQNGIQK